MTDDDFVPPSPRGAGGVSLSAGVAWGLVALLIGCTLLILSLIHI